MKKATIKDVAQLAGVSISAVSYIMNDSTAKKYSEETVEKIKKAAEKLNYTPNNIARGMRSQKSFSIGIVNFWNMKERVFTQTLDGIVNQAAKYSYSTILCPETGDFSYLDYYINKRIDCIIFISPVVSTRIIDEALHIRQMKKAGVPFVIINGRTAEKDVNYFYYNFLDSTFAAANHLIDRGFTKIAYIAPPQEDSAELKDRCEGYCQAMRQHGLEPDVLTLEAADEAALRRVQAVVTNKSDTAKEVMRRAAQWGIQIPKELSLVAGNVENYSQHLFTPLTCAQIPFDKIGRQSVDRLMQNITEKPVYAVESPPCEILEGGSVS